MPVYESLCHVCGKVQDYYQSAANCYDTPTCCGAKTEKVIMTAPYGQVDIPAYVSPVSGKWINSRRERTEDLKRTNSRPWEGMEQETKEADRQKAYQEAKEDAKLEKAVVEAWQSLTPEKQASLADAP